MRSALQVDVEVEAAGLLERAPAVGAVRRAVAAGENLLVYGDPGVGKSALLRLALAGTLRRPIFSAGDNLAAIYKRAVGELTRLGRGSARRRASLPTTSAGCRGFLEGVLPSGPFCLVLDPAPMASLQLAHGLRDLLRASGVPLLCGANQPHQDEIGFLSLFFVLQSEKLHLAPLSPAAAQQFAMREMARVGGFNAEPERMLGELLRYGKGLPGRIRTMTEMTRQARYRSGGHIKLNLIYLDYLTQRGRT